MFLSSNTEQTKNKKTHQVTHSLLLLLKHKTADDFNKILTQQGQLFLKPHLSLVLWGFKEQSVDNSDGVGLNVLISPGIKET